MYLDSMNLPHYIKKKKKKVSGNTSSEFVMRTDFLPYVLRTPVFRILIAWDK